MRHRKARYKLSRTSAHRKAMYSNMLVSFLTHERIRTTLPKAKALRPLCEKMITLGKQDTVHARRLAFSKLQDKNAVYKLFSDIAPRNRERSGGYTRILKVGYRNGDAAPMAVLELVEPSSEVR